MADMSAGATRSVPSTVQPANVSAQNEATVSAKADPNAPPAACASTVANRDAS